MPPPDHPPPRAGLDVSRLATIRPAFLVAAIIALALTVVFAELPGRPLILHALQKLAHPGVFGLIALGVLILLLQRPSWLPAWGEYLLALAVAIAIGGMTELCQIFTHRDPSLRDVGLDARGASCALLLVSAFDARCWRGSRARFGRTAALLVAGALAAMILLPVSYTASAYALRSYRFPVLFRPASQLDLLLVSLTSGSPELAQVASTGRGAGEPALRVPLLARPYAGVSLDEPAADWRGFRELAIEVTNPGRTELVLTIRVHDRSHDWTYEDRYNGDFRVAAGTRQTIEVPLEAIRTAPRRREIDLSRIANVAIFRGRRDSPREFWLHRVELR